MRVYPGDILTNEVTGLERRLLFRVTAVDDDGVATFGIAQRHGDGDNLTDIVRVSIYETDRLVACGAHEDCVASLDLAMACAEERIAQTGSTDQ